MEGNETNIKPKKEHKLKLDKFKVATPTEISDHADGPGYGGG